MNARVVELDPGYAKKERRSEIRFWGALAAGIIALAIGTWAAVVNGEQSHEITQIQHSACQVDAAGKECQQTKAEASRAASIATTCISFWKVGYPCPKPGSKAVSKHETGVVPTTGNPPSSQPEPSTGGSTELPKTPSLPSPQTPSVNPPVNLAPTLEGATESVCSVSALGIKVCN